MKLPPINAYTPPLSPITRSRIQKYQILCFFDIMPIILLIAMCAIEHLTKKTWKKGQQSHTQISLCFSTRMGNSCVWSYELILYQYVITARIFLRESVLNG